MIAKIVALAVVFDPAALNVFAQPKELVSRAISYLLLGLLFALAVRHRRALFVPSPLHFVIGAYALSYVAATVFALDQRLALFGAGDRGLGLLSVLDGVVLYVAIVTTFRSRADVRWLAIAVAATTALLVGYAVVQRLGLDPVPWATAFATVRPFATMGNPGALAQYMVTIAAVGAGLAMIPGALPDRARRLAGGVALGAVVGMLLAGARSAYIGLALASAVLAVGFVADRFLLRARARARSLAIVGAFGSVFALAAILFATAAGGSLAGPIGQVISGGSVSGRADIYRVALEQLRERPWTGVGPDNYVLAYPAHRSPDGPRLYESDEPQTSPHSWLWKIATDAGFLGLLAFAALLVAVTVEVLRHPSNGRVQAVAVGLVAYLATGLFSIGHLATDWLPWLAFGLISLGGRSRSVSAPAPSQQRSKRRSRHRTRVRSPWPVRAIAAVGVIVAAVTVLRPLDAAHAAQAARQALGQGELGPQTAMASAQRAIDLDPGRAAYWNLRGLAHFELREFTTAAQAFDQALRLEPYAFTYASNVARARVNAGLLGSKDELAQGLSAARALAQREPHLAEAYYTLALAEEAAGNNAEAVVAIERARTLRPPTSAAQHLVAARSYLKLDRPDDALRWTRDAFALGSWPRQETIDLRLVAAQALLEQGLRANSANELAAVFVLDPQDRRAATLQARLAKAGADEVMLSERLRSVPSSWRLENGSALGSVRRSVLTIPTGGWRVTLGRSDWGDFRLSLQFRTVAPPSRGSLEVGRWIDGQNAVVVQQLALTNEMRIVLRAAGAESQLAGGMLGSLLPGDWYWIEFEMRGQNATAILYSSGREPTPKDKARAMGALSATVPETGPRNGALTIGSDVAPPIEIGGVDTAPGSVYVEQPE